MPPAPRSHPRQISDLQKFLLTPAPNHIYIPSPSRPTMRGVGHRHERGAGCGGRGSVGRVWWSQGGLIVRERTRRADDRRSGFAKASADGQCPAKPLTRRSPPSDEGGLAKPGGCVRQNRVVLAPVAGVKPAEVRRPNRVSTILQSAGDGGKMNSSPGRARHKP
jgi:hypothetical protein